MRLLERRRVTDSCWIKHHYVCSHPRPYQTAIEQPKTLRRKGRHFSYRLLERECLLLPHIHSKDARERTIATGVRRGPPENRDLAVGANHRRWMPENTLEVLFVDGVEYCRTASLFRDPDCSLSRVLDCRFQTPPLASDLS